MQIAVTFSNRIRCGVVGSPAFGYRYVLDFSAGFSCIICGFSIFEILHWPNFWASRKFFGAGTADRTPLIAGVADGHPLCFPA
jgi:hypothetical protein